MNMDTALAAAAAERRNHGWQSVDRTWRGSVAEVCCDVESLPIHVVVIEALGRNAGWVTAASALAADSYGQAQT